MLTTKNLLDGVETALGKLWPNGKVYQDITPVDFERPSTLVEVTELTMEPVSSRIVDRSATVQVTRFQKVDDYHNTQVAVLAEELTLLLNHFAVPTLAVGDRHLDVGKVSGKYENDFAWIRIPLTWEDDRETEETHRALMEHYNLEFLE